MADAKITLTTEAKNEGLEQLNKALAEGQQSVVEMTRELNNMRKATKEGTEATKEQRDAMVALRQSINEQKATNKEYAKEIGVTAAEIKKSVKAMADGDKGARALAGAFKATEGFTTAFSVALGGLATTITTGLVSALGEMANQVVSLGAQMQQSVSQLAAMTGGVNTATEAYRALNDVYRNTNFDEQAVFNMGEQLMRLGYSAESAAGLIQLCADAAAGLGTGQQGAQQLVDALSRMQAVGELSSRQLQQLAVAGVDMNAAFRSLNMTGEQAMKAIENGTLDSQKAIAALTDYLHQYDGKMAESKNNTIDAWGDVTGNLATMCAEIGKGIFDAFNQSEIVQKLIDFTQSLIGLVRADGCGAFSDLRTVADEVLNFIGGLLGFVLDTFKLIIIIIGEAYSAFKNFGAQVVAAIRPAVDAVMALYDAVKAVMSSIGAGFHSEVGKSWSLMLDSGKEPEERAEQRRTATASSYVPRSTYSTGGGYSGGGGGGSRSGSDTARAEAEAKRKAEAEAKAAAKAYADEFNSIFSAMQADSKSILDMMFGNKDEAARKIEEIKTKLIADMEEIDKAAAMVENMGNGDLNPLAAILKTTPDALAEELATKGQTLAEFIEDYKTKLAEAAAAEAESVKAGKTWHDNLVNYAESVAGSMADSMTDFIMGAKSASEALKDMVKSILQNAVKILSQWLSLFAVFSLVGDPTLAARNASAALFGTNGGSVVLRKPSGGGISVGSYAGHAAGGYITGPGTGTSDSIPAMLSNGEYVLRSAAVDRIGVGTLNAMNAGAIPHFAEGGSVDDFADRGVNNTVNLAVSTVDAASFSDFLDRGGLDRIRQGLFETERRFASTAGLW
jgi:tape measure domain-containing protein